MICAGNKSEHHLLSAACMFLQVRFCGSLWGEADFGGSGKEGMLLEFDNTQLGYLHLLSVQKDHHLVYSALMWRTLSHARTSQKMFKVL